MPIRWNPWAVSKALDDIEQALNGAEAFLVQAQESIERARKIPNLPGYLDQRLVYVALQLSRLKGVRDSIQSARECIPEKKLNKAEAAATQQSML